MKDDLAERLVRAETQIARLVSDAESEKDTRKRANEHIENRFTEQEKRFTKIERIIYVSSGAVAALMFVLKVFWK